MGKYNAAVVRLLQGKKKDEKKRMKEERQKLVGRMMSSAEGGAGVLALNHEARSLERKFAGARRLRCCEEKRKELGRHWQCDSEVHSMEGVIVFLLLFLF